MGVMDVAILVVGALVIGFTAWFVGETHYSFEWLITALAAFVGGYASQLFGGVSVWGPAIGALYLVPALVGALLVAAIVDYLLRTTMGEPAA